MVSITWCVPRLASCSRYFNSQPYPSPKGSLQVSSLGRVCNARGTISLGTLHGSGYKRTQIFGQMWAVHRLVKIAFHGLPKTEEAWQVHHVDGDPANNCLDNLEYVTRTENMLRSYCNPLRRNSGPALSKVVMWRVAGSMSWTTSESITAAAQQLGIPASTVSRCCRNESNAKGYELRFQHAEDLADLEEDWLPMVDPMSNTQVPGKLVSSLGRVISRHGLVSRGYLTKQGYYTTRVHDRNQFVHRLVALAFLGPPPTVSQTFVNHKDLDKGNNAVDNLEWVSTAENNVHANAFLAEARRPRHDRKPIYSRLIDSKNDWTWHPSVNDAASTLSLDSGCVSRCARGFAKKTGSYEFRWADALESSDIPGEEWREVDWLLLQQDREKRGLQ